jgi:hypothetical protein
VLGYHVILRLGDDRVIAPSRAVRRQVASKLADLARSFPLVAWKLADTHLHVLVLGEPGEFLRRLRMWVTRVLRPGVPLELQRCKPLADQSHLVAAFAYVLRQDEHHGVTTDPQQDGSALPDILGLRVLCPELPGRVREALPRLTRARLLDHLGVRVLEEGLHLEHLAEAASAAFGLEVLAGCMASDAARRAAVAAAREAGPTATARALGITPQAACRLAQRPAAPREVRAVRLQMALLAQRQAGTAFAS